MGFFHKLLVREDVIYRNNVGRTRFNHARKSIISSIMFPCLNILTFNRTFDKSWNDIYEQATYTLAEATPAAIAAGAQ